MSLRSHRARGTPCVRCFLESVHPKNLYSTNLLHSNTTTTTHDVIKRRSRRTRTLLAVRNSIASIPQQKLPGDTQPAHGSKHLLALAGHHERNPTASHRKERAWYFTACTIWQLLDSQHYSAPRNRTSSEKDLRADIPELQDLKDCQILSPKRLVAFCMICVRDTLFNTPLTIFKIREPLEDVVLKASR